jgi:hypothetical protein
MDAGVAEPRRHVFVARVAGIATLILARSPFSADQLAVLRNESARLGFEVLVDPDHQPASPVLRAMVDAPDRRALDAVGAAAPLDLTVPTDSRPFFFNQLRFGDIPAAVGQLRERRLLDGVVRGNLTASITLVLILGIAAAAVVCTIVLPLRRVARQGPPALVAAGTAYFALIGMGFMLAEIALLQYFGVFLGHPVYAMGVCLFAVIASTGVGSLLAGRLPLRTQARVVVWAMLVGGSLIGVQALVPGVFAATTAAPLPTRIAVCLALVTPIGVAMGFGFPTGMALVARVDDGPTPWFWGINGAVGVLASVLAVMIGISYGIDASLVIAGLCYLLLVAPAVALLRLGDARAR